MDRAPGKASRIGNEDPPLDRYRVNDSITADGRVRRERGGGRRRPLKKRIALSPRAGARSLSRFPQIYAQRALRIALPGPRIEARRRIETIGVDHDLIEI